MSQVPESSTDQRGLSRALHELRHRDHTQGRILVSIFVLALPPVISSSGMAIFQLFDLRFLGQIGGEAVAAAGATNQTLRQLFQVSAFGLSVAIQMMIAFAVGRAARAEAEALRRSMGTSPINFGAVETGIGAAKASMGTSPLAPGLFAAAAAAAVGTSPSPPPAASPSCRSPCSRRWLRLLSVVPTGISTAWFRLHSPDF